MSVAADWRRAPPHTSSSRRERSCCWPPSLVHRHAPPLGKQKSPVFGFGDGMTHVILVVEDNERNLKLLRDVLEFAGYDVRAARTAEDGLALAASEPPDLVLMDLQLPGIDG